MRTAVDVLLEKNRPIISVKPDTTIFKALKIMVKNKIGAILVKKNNNIIGIYTERDFLQDSIKKDFNPQTALIKDHMTTELLCADYNEPVYKLMDKVLGKYIRHLLVMKEGKYIGLLSAGDITRACLNEKTKEIESISWDYYENWRWKKRK